MSVGVIVGTYSSIFVASPLLVLWKLYREGGAAQQAVAATDEETPRRARTVRTPVAK